MDLLFPLIEDVEIALVVLADRDDGAEEKLLASDLEGRSQVESGAVRRGLGGQEGGQENSGEKSARQRVSVFHAAIRPFLPTILHWKQGS